MTRPAVPVHYLRENARNWSPRSVIFLDTETREVVAGKTDVLGLRLWVARYVDRRTAKDVSPRHVTTWGTTAPALARWVDDVTRNREAVWLFSHNLSFDLTVSRLPLTLVSLGWRINDAAIGGKSPWLRLARGKRVLTLVDSGSWLPLPLEEVAARMLMRKPPLPGAGDPAGSWLHRCGHDVDIMATAVLDLMDWWDARKLGNWSISGPACGWNAYRHIPTTSRVVIDPDSATVKADRTYVHGGRRGTWSIGQHTAGPFYELDFVAAYPTVAAHLPHPVERAYTFQSMSLDDPNLTSDRWGVTARCRLTSRTAYWPVRIGHDTWYPVGDYFADLAGPDIAEARRLGCLAQVGPGQVHKLAANMTPWARWVLDVQNGADPDQPAVAAIVARAWGRSVIGKWSQHAYVRVPMGPSPCRDWGYEAGWDRETDTEGGWVDLAGQRWWVHSGGDPENAYPAVQAWVEAEVRVRLGRVIDALGERAVLQCDTDGLIVAGRLVGTHAARGHLVAPDGLGPTGRLNWCLDQIDPVAAPLTLRVKAIHAHVTVLGPQHVVTGSQRRFAGMRRDALLGDDGRYHAKLWPGLQWQMTHGDPRGYVRPTQSVRVQGPYPTGWILADRTVVPVECEITDDDRTRIVPWHKTGYARDGLRRADVQHASLDALI